MPSRGLGIENWPAWDKIERERSELIVTNGFGLHVVRRAAKGAIMLAIAVGIHRNPRTCDRMRQAVAHHVGRLDCTTSDGALRSRRWPSAAHRYRNLTREVRR